MSRGGGSGGIGGEGTRTDSWVRVSGTMEVVARPEWQDEGAGEVGDVGEVAQGEVGDATGGKI